MDTELRTPYADLMPGLTDAQLRALEIRIKDEGGIHDPVLVTDDGVVLDGHNRLNFDPNAARKVIAGSRSWPDLDRQAFVCRANMGRRNLSHQQRDVVLKTQIRIAKAMRKVGGDRYTQERIATRFGVLQNTVSDWLRPRGHTIGADSVTPVSDHDCRVKVPPKMRAEVAEMARKHGIKKTADQLGLSESTVKRIKTVEEKADAQNAERKATLAKVGDDVLGIHHGDFRELGKVIKDDSIDLIFTDPPYDKDAVPLYGDLTEFASRVLRPGGWCLAYAGHSFLPDVYRLMAEHLTYAWTFECHHSGGDFRYRKLKLQSKWKPIIGLYKPPLDVWWEWFADSASGGREKVDAVSNEGRHEWQQPVAEAAHFIDAMCPVGGLVCDPFCGSGTTCVAAKQLDMRWIAFEIEEKHVETARVKLV